MHALEDGETVEAGGLRFECWDSHGHARHHQVFSCGDIAWAGDSIGCRLPGEKHIALTSAPPQFDPEAWEVTLDRLEGKNHKRLYPTHFGVVEDVADHLSRFREVLRTSSAFVRDLVEKGATDSEIREAYRDFCRKRAKGDGASEATWERYEGANPTWMCADGIALYWRKRLAEESA